MARDAIEKSEHGFKPLLLCERFVDYSPILPEDRLDTHILRTTAKNAQQYDNNSKSEFVQHDQHREGVMSGFVSEI
jgi:hypothetical protein